MKDLVNSPVKKYQDIFDTITNTNTNYNKYLPNDNDNDYTDINLLPTENTNTNSSGIEMKDELKMFLKKQLNNTSHEVEGLGQDIGFGSSF